MSEQEPWFRRFFREEYLLFDDHPDTAKEVAFIVETLGLKPNMRVLDLCCGYGRHTIPMASQGLDLVGFDLSPALLKEAQKSLPGLKNADGAIPSLVRGDMRHLPFEGCCDAVISMFTSIGYFDETENFHVLGEIRGSLKLGGAVLIQTVNRDAIVRHFRPTQVYRPDGMIVIEERMFDPVSARSTVDVTVIKDGTETRLHHDIRLYTFTELDMLLSASGLAVDGVWGDFEGGAFSWNSASMIVLAKKSFE